MDLYRDSLPGLLGSTFSDGPSVKFNCMFLLRVTKWVWSSWVRRVTINTSLRVTSCWTKEGAVGEETMAAPPPTSKTSWPASPPRPRITNMSAGLSLRKRDERLSNFWIHSDLLFFRMVMRHKQRCVNSESLRCAKFRFRT